jgi:LPXTG-motif cell wall-anchored protein
MKKTLAAVGASILGLASAGIAAAPAQAADLEPCTSATQHDITGNTTASPWYSDCVPQFGLGKVEFSIDSDIDFPETFADLTDPTVDVQTNVDSEAATAYSDGNVITNGFADLQRTDGGSAHSQTYSGQIAFAVAGVGPAPEAEWPEDCFPDDATTYGAMWKVTYVPTTVTFTQTVDGEEWVYSITSAPPPLYLGLPAEGSNSEATCASSGDYLLQGDGNTVRDDEVYLLHAAYITGSSILSPFPVPNESIEQASVGQLGAFRRVLPVPPTTPPTPVPVVPVAIAPAPAPAPEPVLAATGLDAMVPFLGAASAVGLGALGLVLVRRRRGLASGPEEQ